MSSPPKLLAAIADDRLRHQRQGLVRFLGFLGADGSLAEDLAQETFVRLLDAGFEDRGDAALASWLRQTAHHLYRSTGRQLRRTIATLDAATLDRGFAAATQADPTGAAHLQALEGCLARLPERDRQALSLRHGEQLDRTVLAARFGVSVEGIKSLLRRARERLRICMETTLQEER